MTIGTRIDSLLAQIPQDALRSVALASLPLALVALYIRFVHVPSAERGARFHWQAPPEIESDWSSQVISSPSIHSHLDTPSLARPASSSDAKRAYITAYAPASAQHLATIPSANAQEIRDKISRAVEAQKGWKTSSYARRRRVLRTLLEFTVDEMQALAKMASRDSGKTRESSFLALIDSDADPWTFATVVDAAFGEILTTCEKLRWTIANGEEALKPEYRPTNLLLAHKVSKVVYEPLGVVAAIVSWNYPIHNALSPIIAALFSGNAIVVKPSENVAWSSLHVVEAVRSCLAACGEDPDLVQVAVTLPDSVEALTGDARIKHITFIGSEEIGKKVALKAAEVGTPVLLELGGKDPAIILPSADVAFFMPTWLRAVFQAASQNCIGAERFLVHASLYPSFVSLAESKIRALQLGDVLAPDAGGQAIDVGAMVTDRLFDQLEALIREAVDQGARCLVGGKRADPGRVGAGHYFEPTLLVDVTPNMAIAQHEIFAPVMTVLKYDTLAQAVEIANGTRYGLGASVFGRNQNDCRWVMDRLECGMVCSNDFGVFYLNQSLPFGGAKASGNALRFAGPEGLRGLCNLKAVTEDRFHGVVQTGIPPLLAYPIRVGGTAAWKFVAGLVRFAYGKDAAQRARGISNLITAK